MDNKNKKIKTRYKKYLVLKEFHEKTKAFQLYINEKKVFFKSHYRSILVRFLFYLLGVYIFGLANALYMDLNLGVVNEDLLVFSLAADIWVKGGSNIAEYYSISLLIIYTCFWLVVVLFKTIKIFQFKKQKILTLNIIFDEIIKIILDLIPVFLWPLAVKLNIWIINPDWNIKPIDPTNMTGNEAIWNEWVRSWILWASYLAFCLGLGIIVATKMLPGPYNGLSSELSQITRLPYPACRIAVDSMLIVLGVGLLFLGNYPLQDRLNHLYSWISYATILMAFFSGPVSALILTFFNNYIRLELLDIDKKLYQKLRREVLREFKMMNTNNKKQKIKWRILQDEIFAKYNALIKDNFLSENRDAKIIDLPIK
ncbi:SPE_1075/MLC_0560 family membrane protein [Spiroplasma eriocheiris]|uniref:Transmembrane protein n=1 Tax=Spiroplasma eriocheiris TaxID=315358 RepID=A0A0H3XMN3_9MOLU|nr:hypothetical protein [Spiroplasma eriocheiris]AHF57804.1 hypothetical protein SPE_0679 [Spiroplasma eriocheiris CCTCC M 207170]AKM54252.1 hypothetical protein SERIO_v1c06870 [Spiroplasma eriocheiris]